MPPPPKYALRFLRWFCREDLLEEVEGNLLELYQKTYLDSERKANRQYYFHVISHFRPECIRSFSLTPSIFFLPMFRNYFLIAWRNLTRNTLFSAINTAGLSLGLISFIMTFLWIQDEKNVDSFHHKNDVLYNAYQRGESNGDEFGDYSTFHRRVDDRVEIPIEGAKEALPNIKRLSLYATGYELPWGHPMTFRVGESIHKLEGSRANTDFLHMFSFPIIAGDKDTPLSDISKIAISRKMALLFFDSPEDAIGKTIRYENRLDFSISAVFEDVPAKSTLQFEYLINWESHLTQLEWASHQILTTIQVGDEVAIEGLEKGINHYFASHYNQEEGIHLEIGLQKFKDRYLVSNFVNGRPQGGRIEYVRILGIAAIFILLLACINFMNLSTARSIKRSKEVGIRKVIGSLRGQLIGQFLGEAILLALGSLLISLAACFLLLPLFNAFTGKEMLLPLSSLPFWGIMLGVTLLAGLVAGSYPALYLSGLKPIQVLKGSLRFSTSSLLFRKGLSVFQFSISIFLLIATLVVSQQTQYIQHTHLGYDKENLLYVRVEGELQQQKNYLRFKQEASIIPGVNVVDRSSETPHIMNFLMSEPFDWEGREEDQYVGFKPASVGFDFIELMNLKVVEGRGFSREMATDSAEAFLVNEEAIRQMGIEDPLGKWISAWNKKGKIIGVLKDFHTHSLHEPITPIIIDVKEYEYFGVILIRTIPGNMRKTLAELERVYQDINPNYPFDYQFVDQEYGEMYKSEAVIASLSQAISILAILISCLGLLGLAMYAAEQRTKEISIRKVLGASISHIVGLFSREFMGLVGLAFFIAVPVGWILMNSWLESFAYRVDLAWWMFALAGLLALAIAFLTVCTQSLKVAFMNPIHSLKEE